LPLISMSLTVFLFIGDSKTLRGFGSFGSASGHALARFGF
jgi:hypothetical protein